MMGLKMMALKPTRAAAKRESDRYSVEVKRPISRKRLRRSTRLLESRILRAKPNSTQTQPKPTNLDGFDFKVPPFKRPKTARAVSSSSEKLKKKIFEREVDEEEAAATEEDVGLETDGSQENETEKTNERVKKYSKKKRDTTGESLMCHQCQRNDKGRVINCKTCRRKRFCIPCITTWYPGMSEDEIADTCPACRDNCNCMSCLRKGGSTKKLKETLYLQFTEDEQVQHSKYLLQWLLPHIKHFSQEQMEEKVMEAKIQGVFPSELQLQQEFPAYNNRLYCGNCRTSIADYHRSCPRCNYVLCLICCREIREGHLQGGEKEVNIEYVDRGPAYAHGLARWKANENGSISCPPSPAYAHGLARWKANENGSISCPPKDLGGCGNDLLVLRSMFTENDVVELVEKAEAIAKDLNIETTLKSPKQKCLCYTSTGEIDFANSKPRKAASREDSTDNYLYCPTAKDIQNRCSKHFQMHWKKGEPVIVTNVLENTPGLSWEPFVLWRALRRIKSTKSEQHLNVKAIDCLYWSEVEINLHQFFKGYKDGRFDSNWPQILKLKDLPAFQKHLPRHHAEFLCCLPLKEYTHPYYGFLNLATKSSGIRPEPEMVTKLHIAYGLAQELVRGDSVIKLRCDMSDVVNVLVHAAEIKLTPEQLADITKAKVRHREQDLKELFGTRIKADGVKPDCCSTQNGVEDVEGGAIWDVFRREDVPKLRDYLNKHFREFRHIYCCPVQQVVDPIHDQSFYLTVDHKSKLKGEYGIEPWTFVQKLGEAVLIPAGCPYQVRNIKSCVKVSLDFVSPESIGECVCLTEEFRVLPHGHTAKVDKLEVRRMALRAMCSAVNRLDRNAWIKLSYSRQKKVATPGFRQGTLNSNPSGKHGVGRQVETEVDSIVTNDMEDPDSDEEDEVVHDQETEVQNEAVVRDPDEGRMVNGVKIEEVAIESGNDMDPDEDPDSDEEDEVVHDQETEVQNEAVVRDPDEVRIVNDVKIEEVAIESGNDMDPDEDPDRDEEDEVVHDQETEVQNEAVVRDPDEGRMVNDVKIEEVAIESGNDMDPDEDPDSDEEDEVVHDQETEVQNEAVVRDPDEGRMVNDVKIEEVAIESGNDMDPDEDPDSDEEDEVVHDQETEVQNEAVVRDPDEVRMVNDVKIEEVAIESGNDMEDPDPIDTTAPTYPEEHAACSAQHTDCCIVDFYGFLVSTIHKPYLEVIYDIEGAFWKSCAIQSPEWISSLLRLFGDALKLSDTPWCLLSREDIVRMVRSIEDAKAVGFSVNCLEPLMEEARTMIASYDNCVGLKDQCSRVEEEIETVKGKLESLKNQRRELKRKMFTHSSTVGRSSTAFSFVSRVNYTLVGSPKWESA